MVDKDQIVLKKVRVHNLKEVDLTLNKNQLIVFTGVSGSGKSSLVFDILYPWLDNEFHRANLKIYFFKI